MFETQALPVIPVIDILAGQVVRAWRGQRSTYRPIESPRVAGSAPIDVARSLLEHPACRSQPPVLYVADLDALQGRPVQAALLVDLLAALEPRFPGLCLWLDAGFGDLREALALRRSMGAAGARVRPVFGSESVTDVAALAAIGADADAILSLDSRQAEPLDPAACWRHAELWPAAVIVMTLDRVGTGSGPDLSTFARLRSAAPDRCWIGAGGVRDRGDLDAASAAGAQAWLVASALHDGGLLP